MGRAGVLAKPQGPHSPPPPFRASYGEGGWASTGLGPHSAGRELSLPEKGKLRTGLSCDQNLGSSGGLGGRTAETAQAPEQRATQSRPVDTKGGGTRRKAERSNQGSSHPGVLSRSPAGGEPGKSLHHLRFQEERREQEGGLTRGSPSQAGGCLPQSRGSAPKGE